MIDQEDKEEILEMAAAIPLPLTTTQCSSALCHNRADLDGSPAPFCTRCSTTGAPRIGDDPYA